MSKSFLEVIPFAEKSHSAVFASHNHLEVRAHYTTDRYVLFKQKMALQRQI